MKKFLKVCKRIVLSLAIISTVGVVSMYLWVRPTLLDIKENVFNRMVNISEDTFRLDTDTVIYDASGKVLTEINANNYIYVGIDDISKYVIDGYIAVEDTDFATHKGISLTGILRAGMALVKNDGVVTQGGSTITQQVLKNNVFTDIDSKFERKVLEIFLAPEFEKVYSKSQIMEFYLNTNYYQNGCYGIGSAANYYFGKSAKDLSLSESAILVGLSNNPSKYNPVKNPVASREKRDFVLGRMLSEGKISQYEYDSALGDNPLVNGVYELALNKEYRETEDYLTSYAVYGSVLKLMELDGFEFKYSFASADEYESYKALYNSTFKMYAEDVRNGDYKIYTSLSPTRQAELQRIVDSTLDGVSKEVKDGKYALQGSATLVNNYSGLVEAIVGGRGIEDEYNRGYLSTRQPGSAIKPLVVYAPAFETGNYYPSLIVKDYAGENFPKNANRSYLGDMSIREAVARSTNTVPYEILQKIGVSNGVNYLAKMGFSNLALGDFDNYAMALGGMTYGTNTSEMAKAYSTLASGGVYTDNTCILKIEYKGDVIYEYTDKEKEQVYSSDVAYMVLDTLRGVSDLPYGTGKGAKLDNIVSVGKTGTTNGNKDAWYCGTTVDYSLSVWVGYDTPKAINSGSKATMDIYTRMMEYLYSGKKSQEFRRPATIRELNIDNQGKATDKDTGKKDIFSGTLIDKANEDEQARKDRELELAMQLERESEKALIDSISSDIENLKDIVIKSVRDYDNYIHSYNYLVADIGNIKDTSTRDKLLKELKSDYDARLVDDTILRYKADSERQAKEVADLEAKQKAEIERQEAINHDLEVSLDEQRALIDEQLRLTVELSIANLDRLVTGGVASLEEYDKALDDARVKLDSIKGSQSYGSYLSKLANLEGRLEDLLVSRGYRVDNLDDLTNLSKETTTETTTMVDVDSLLDMDSMDSDLGVESWD